MNKIGLHIIGGWSGNLGKPRLVKLMDASPEYVAELRQAIGSEALIIVRWYQAEQPLDNPLARAQQFVARYQSAMLAMRNVVGPNIAFEGYNEVPDSEAAAYCAFEVERLRLMHEVRLSSVVGNFSVGTPDIPIWTTYQPMLEAMQPGDLLGLHEYWADTADINNRWHCGRWTMVSELARRPVVITECGRDVVEGRGAPGWRRTCDGSTFLKDLETYNALLEQHPNVVGAAVFTTPGPAGGWADFDPTPVWPQIVASYSDPQTYPGMSAPLPPPSPPAEEEPMPYIANVSAPGVSYRDWYGTQMHSSRYGRPITHIVLHDPEATVPNGLQATLSTITNEPRSYHDVIDKDGTIYRCVPYDRAAWHCGGSHIPGISDGSYYGTSEVNLRTVGVCMVNSPAYGPWPPVQLAATILHIRELCRVHQIPADAEHVLCHAQINAAKRDPRNVNWPWVLVQLAWAGAVGLSTGWPHDQTEMDPAELADKLRWWMEQALREHEAGYGARGLEIHRDLVDLQAGLLYRLERALKAR